MIRYMEEKDRNECMNMMEEFYATDAVVHSIPRKYIETSIDYALNQSPYTKIIVILKDSEYAGYCNLSFTYSSEVGGIVVLIEELYVRDAYKGQGFGSAAINFVRSEYDDKAGRYRIEVTEDNVDAIRLYKRMGFDYLGYKQMILDLPT